MKDNMFEQLDFGAFKEYIEDDDITDISYTNNGQIWLRSLEKGSFRVENPNINNAAVEKLAFQCSNVMGTTFNNASPFLDAESPELRMNFVHESIATNGIALVIRKTPAKIRLKEENLLKDEYVTKDIHDFLIKCVLGHCNIMVCGETGSGKTEFVKYLASHTKENEKIITIEDTLELHLDKIYPNRDIVAMKTNNIASYTEVLVTCMRQNPKWILLSEVRSAEAVTAVRNSISSGHNILSTIHSDKASAIPHRLYSLMETDLDLEQFLNTIYRYIQLGVHIKAYYSPKYGKFHSEIDEITEFYIDEETNEPVYNVIYHKTMTGKVVKKQPSEHLMNFLLGQNIDVSNTTFESDDDTNNESSSENINLAIKEDNIFNDIPIPTSSQDDKEESGDLNISTKPPLTLTENKNIVEKVDGAFEHIPLKPDTISNPSDNIVMTTTPNSNEDKNKNMNSNLNEILNINRVVAPNTITANNQNVNVISNDSITNTEQIKTFPSVEEKNRFFSTDATNVETNL